MNNDKDKELEQNAGIRKREEELEKKRKHRIHKIIAFICVLGLLSAGAFISRTAYKDLISISSRIVIPVDSMYLGADAGLTTVDKNQEQPEADDTEAVTEIEDVTTSDAKEEITEENVSEEIEQESTQEISTETEETLESMTDESVSEEDKETVDKKADNNKQDSTKEKEETKEEATKEEKQSEEKNAGTEYLCISPEKVNLRSKPSKSGSVIGKVMPKTTVLVIDHDKSGWYHVSYNGLEGYVVDTVLRIK